MKSICILFKGDSGGPLVKQRDNGSWELIGLVSFSRGCAVDLPGVYVDVYYYKEWIRIHTPGASINGE